MFSSEMKKIPDLLSTVRLKDGNDVYLVVALHPHRKVVEVISITEPQYLIPDLPLSRIQEVVEGPPIYM
jgi:hypothetical protein